MGYGTRRYVPTKITYEDGWFELSSPYNQDLVNAIKTIPPQHRSWDSGRHVWRIAATDRYGKLLVQLAQDCLGENITLPLIPDKTPQLSQVRVLYLGMTKERVEFSERIAYGWVGTRFTGRWEVAIPESVLRAWFHDSTAGGDQEVLGNSLYAVLGIVATATLSEIKTAYRRLALHLHPDHNHEPDAHEQFLRLQEAYEILRDPGKKSRYDAGLALEKSVGTRVRDLNLGTFTDSLGYRTPIRCGILSCIGWYEVGKFLVQKIIEWRDIARSDGKILSTSWDRTRGDRIEQALVEEWV